MLDDIFKRHHCDKASTGHNYTPYYERAFSGIRENRLRILELGIGGYEHPDRGGQSLRAWKEYFPNSAIYGIDLYDKKALEEERIYIHQCSQDDAKGLEAIIKDIGVPDVIIDDASHHNNLTISTFNILFPMMNRGGVYVVEDTHTSYWDRISSLGEDFKGGVHPHTTLNFFKGLTDDINWEEAQRLLPVEDKRIHSMTFGKGILIIEKS